MSDAVDVIVVGGGPAGLSAALLLGRSRRTVVVCDAGRPRNARAPHSHGYLTRDGMPPLDLLALGRDELRAYPVTVRATAVTGITCTAAGAAVVLSDGTSLTARKLLLATGVEDVRPDVPGCDALYGVSVHHCPYCDGWENRDRPPAVYGPPQRAAGLALSLLTWSRDLVVCTNGRRWTAAASARLTGVANLFVAGDANGDVQFVVVAAAEGAKAAVTINKELQDEDRR